MNRTRSRVRHAQLVALACVPLACGTSAALPEYRPFAKIGPSSQSHSAEAPEPVSLPELDGSIGAYLRFAVENSPRLRASFERWRSAMYGVRTQDRLPEPTITFGYYARSVETRVGPHRYHIGVSQSIPWLSKLTSQKAAHKERANALALETDAEVLAIHRDIARQYWALWLVDEELRLRTEHDVVLESLAATIRGRMQTGAASLADLNQVELTVARHHDHREAHEEARVGASARLVATLGASGGPRLVKTADAPTTGVPREDEAALIAQAMNHPAVGRYGHLARSEQHKAKASAADRYPRFTVGANFIGTGEAAMAGTPDSGKDALVVSAGISVPLWGASYSNARRSAQAARAAHVAMETAARHEAAAAVREALAELRDSQRRLELYEETLLPQAQATFEAVIGGYQVKSSSVSAVLLAQRDLIELQVEYARMRAGHATSLAHLAYVVGSPLALMPANGGSADDESQASIPGRAQKLGEIRNAR